MSIHFYNDIKQIPTYPLYGITKQGKVYSKAYARNSLIAEWREIRPTVDKQGYIYFTIRSESHKPKKIKVHRLILMTFDRMPKYYEIGRHLDGNNKNNNLLNLKWGTHKENTYDAFHIHKTRFSPKNEKHWNCKLSNKQINEIRFEYSKGNVTHKELGDKYRVSSNQIYKIIKNKQRIL